MKNKSIGSLILLAVLGPSCGGGGGGSAPPKAPIVAQWQTQQRVPTSSDLRAVMFANPSQGIVAGRDGSFLRTDDGGDTWTQQEFLPPHRSGDIMAMSAYGTTLVAAGVDEALPTKGRLWDGRNSTSWVTSDAAATGEIFTDANVSDPGSGNVPGTYWLLRRNGVVDYSFNGLSGNFPTVNLGPFPPPPACQLPPRPVDWTDANGIAMIGVSGQGLIVGQDNGYAGDGGIVAPCSPTVPATSQRLTGRGQIIRTFDFGATWSVQKIMPDETWVKTLRRIFLTTNTDGITRGYVCGEDMSDFGVLLVSSHMVDGQWDKVAGTLMPTNSPRFRALSFPVNDQTGWVVGDGGRIYKITANVTTDPGDPTAMPPIAPFKVYNYSWELQATGTAENLYAISMVSNSIGFAVGDKGTVLKYESGAWTSKTKGDVGITFNAASFTDDGTRGIAVGNTGKIYRTLDGGLHWTSMTSGTAENLLGASIPRTGTGMVGYVCGNNGQLRRNSDVFGLGTWTLVSGVTAGDTYKSIAFPNGDGNGVCVGIASGGGSKLLRTINGTTWAGAAPAPTLPSVSYNAVSGTPDGLTVYAAGGTNGLVSSSTDVLNGWLSWTNAPTPGSLNLLSLQSPGGGSYTAFAGAGDAKVYRLEVASGTWISPLASPFAGATAASLGFQDQLNGVAVTNTGLIFTTIDGASGWNRSYPHTKDNPRAVWMSPTHFGVGYVVCDDGTILKTTTGGW